MYPSRPRQGVEAACRSTDYCRFQQVQRQPFGGLVARENRSQTLTKPSRTTTIERWPVAGTHIF